AFSIMVVRLPRASVDGARPPAPGTLLEEPIATFQLVEGYLCLVWNPRHATAHAGQLANATVRMSLQDQHKLICLRKPVPAAPISIDLSKSTQRIPLRVDSLPEVGEASVLLLGVEEVTPAF